MYKVIITTNDGLNKSIIKVVSKVEYNTLLNSQNLGGFRRYNIDLYSDNEPKQKSEIDTVLDFINKLL